MFHNVAWQSILHSHQHLNYLVEVVASHVKHFDDPRKNSARKNIAKFHFVQQRFELI